MAALLVAVLIGWLLPEYTCFSLVADKPYQQVPSGGTYRFICKADVPLAGCQARDVFYDKVYDLSGGNRSKDYWGSGLENGQCGFSVKKTESFGNGLPYGCRARTQDGAWEYATMAMGRAVPSKDGILPLVTGPRTLRAVTGSTVNLTMEAGGQPLQQCQFTWPGVYWTSSGSTNSYSIDNANLSQGRCRLTLFNVRPATSGVIVGFAESTAGNGNVRNAIQTTTLIVQQAPSAPALTLSKADGVYNEGDVMLASCHVGLARPVARVTWLLNDDVIQGDAEDFSKWPWEFEAGSVTRKLSRHLSMTDDGKELVCRVNHIALPGGVVDARTKISVGRLANRIVPVDPETTAARTIYVPPTTSTPLLVSPRLTFDLDPETTAARAVYDPPTTSTLLLDSPRLTWLLIDLGGSLLVFTVVVVALLVWTRATGRRCCARQCDHNNLSSPIKVTEEYRQSYTYDDVPFPKMDDMRQSNIYDDTMEMPTASAPKLFGRPDSDYYDEVDTTRFV